MEGPGRKAEGLSLEGVEVSGVERGKGNRHGEVRV